MGEKMLKQSGLLAIGALLLAGCASKQPTHSLVTPPPPQIDQTQQNSMAPADHDSGAFVPAQSADTFAPAQSAAPAADGNTARIQECRKELDAMQSYSKASYDAYLAEFQKVGAQTNKYLQIKGGISSDINDLAMPRYQFQIRELCFRIKTRLTQLIIRQS